MANQIIASPAWSDRGTLSTGATEEAGFEASNSWLEFGLHPTWKALSTAPVSAVFTFQDQLAGPVNFLGLVGLRPESAHRNMLSSSHNMSGWTGISFLDRTPDSVVGPLGETGTWNFTVNGTVHAPTEKYSNIKIENRTSVSAQLTLSVYLKDATTNAKLTIADSGAANNAYGRYDLSTGATINSGTNGTGFTLDSISMTAAGNGWYLCKLTCTTNAAAAIEARIGLLNSLDTDLTDDGDAGLAIDIFAAQVEIGDTATTDRHLVNPSGEDSDDPAACFRLRMGVDSGHSTWTWDSGLQMVAQDQHDFRSWEKVHVPYLTGQTTERYLYAQLDIFDEFATTVNLGRFILDNAWIAPLVVKGSVNMLSFSAKANLQSSGAGVLLADEEPNKRSATYPLTLQSMSDAFNRYDVLSQSSTREVFFVLTDTPGRMQRESVFALSDWSPLIRSGNLWKGGISLLEF